MNAPLDDPALAARCPMHRGAGARRALEVSDALVLPLHRRTVVQYALNEAGERELRLFYGDKEISFDEPDLFVFGETLARQSRFVAGVATTWGGPLEWSRVRDLLQTLLAEGVLVRAEAWDGDVRVMGREGERDSPLPPAQATHARTWDECAAITSELAGRAVDPGHLELVVPIFRVAHMSVDADGRQVGEANVFPPALRLDVPTRWRTCIYEGTRHQVDKPMNVTALKAMRAHWGTMMAALLEVRAAYLRRFPEARAGWTVGHIERLSVAVLAVASYPLMRKDAAQVGNGHLHPALSSLFRVTDGLRMTMHQMMFVPVGEDALPPDTPMTGAQIHDYAERNYSFHAGHGVCAGPRAMVDEFLAVLLDGAIPRDGVPDVLEAPVRAALDDMDAALDYGFLGLKAYAAAFSAWPLMARAYDDLLAIATSWLRDGNAAVRDWHDTLAENVAHIHAVAYLATEERRLARERTYADMYAQCERAVSGHDPEVSLVRRLAPPTPLAMGGAPFRTLHAAVRQRLGADSSEAAQHAEATARVVLDCLRRVQAALGAADDAQGTINTHLGRSQPARAFGIRDLEVHNRLRGHERSHAQPLIEVLEDAFDLVIEVDARGISITDSNSASPAAAPTGDTASDDSVSSGIRALRTQP
jgi:hypothetical protein